MKKLATLFITICLAFSCNYTNYTTILIETDLGNITVELYDEQAPATVTNFLSYVDSGMYNNGEFYRVVDMENQPDNNINIEVIQGGLGWDDSIQRLPTIAHETTKQTGIKHENGTISMARNEPGTASSEFFICINNQPELDFGGNRNPDKQGFAAFGKVTHGMDVVHHIHQLPNTEQLLKPSVRIIRISRIK